MELYHNIKIISGGQTGVDRAALDFALENNIPCGGFCTNDRKAEDGRIKDIYPLVEISNNLYNDRTEKNITNSDGTLILYQNKLDKGTEHTFKLCNAHKKPVLVIKVNENETKHIFHIWLKQNNINILNIAGPRENNEPGVYEFTRILLNNLFNC